MKQTRPIIHNRDHEHGGADVVRIAWETIGGGPDPPVLGNPDVVGDSFSGSAGRKAASKFTLAGPVTVTGLHARVRSYGTGPDNLVLHLHADTAGSPGALLAYTDPITAPGTAYVEIAQDDLSVPLTAGSYWLGLTFTNGQAEVDGTSGAGSLKAILSGAAVHPPSNPFGTPDYSAARTLTVWAVGL